MKKLLLFVSIIAIVFIGKNLFIQSTTPTKRTGDNYIIKAIKAPQGLAFAGEEVPVHLPDIKERIDREFLVNTYWQSNGLLLIKRTHKYFPIIEPILKSYGIPDDFKYLAVAESGLVNVTSPMGAKGFWQLMKNTAKENGLEVNSNVDERYHIEKSTHVACKYLLKAKKEFGTWTKAAAAYNLGIHGLKKRLNTQLVDSYYDVLLPEETSRYVPRILAMREILTKPHDYGFVYEEDDLYKLPEYKTVKVDTVIINIALFAKQFDTNYKELKILNPWLKENKLNNRTKVEYEIKIPTK